MIGYGVELTKFDGRTESYFCDNLDDANELFDEYADFVTSAVLRDWTDREGRVIRAQETDFVKYDESAARAAYDRIMAQN